MNFSRRQLVDAELIEKVSAIFEQTSIEPGRVIFEVTESALIHDADSAAEIFDRLRRIGVPLHLDDFGTGYSSLSCLYQLPLSGLKIDREFVRNAAGRASHQAVLRAIVDIARAFQLRVIAEGVETTEQVALLRSLGIEHGQGFLFGKATGPEDAEKLLCSQPTLSHV